MNIDTEFFENAYKKKKKKIHTYIYIYIYIYIYVCIAGTENSWKSITGTCVVENHGRFFS